MEEYERSVVKRVAFVTRYSSATLTEALACDTQFIMLFASCLAEIVSEENRVPGSDARSG